MYIFGVFITFLGLVCLNHCLEISKTYPQFRWTDGARGCKDGSKILNIENVPLSHSAWSAVNFERNEHLWIGGYNKLTSFYWTTGECYKYKVSDKVQRENFKYNSMKNCALFCKDSKYIALQDTGCYCLSQAPAGNATSHCNSSCPGDATETCGSVKDSTYYVYDKLSDSSSPGEAGIRWIADKEKEFNKHCLTLFPSGGSGNQITYFWELLSCSVRKRSLCQNGDTIYIMTKLSMWGDAKQECIAKNRTLAEVNLDSLRAVNTIMLDNGVNYWIGLRRFSSDVYIHRTDNLPSNPASCLAVRKERGDVEMISLNCTTQLKVACIKASNLGSEENGDNEMERTTRKEQVSENENIDEVTKTSTIDDNGTTTSSGPIIGAVVGVILFILIGLILFILYRRKSRKLQRTPSYREPQIEYNSKRQESESETLNQSGNNNKVGTPPQKPIRRTKSANASHKGIEYENIVLALEDPKALSKAVSLGSDASPRTSSPTRGAVVSNSVEEDHYDTAEANNQTGGKLRTSSQRLGGTVSNSVEEDHYDTTEANNLTEKQSTGRESQKSGLYGMNSTNERQSTGNVYGFGEEKESEYDVMNKDRTQNDDPNPDYDHMESIIKSAV